MIRKKFIAVLAGMAVLSAGAALAGTVFSSSAHNFPSDSPSVIYQRYFSAGSSSINPNAPNVCGSGGVNVETAADGTFCKLLTRNTGGGFYGGYDEGTDNFYPPGTGDGNTFQSVFDMQTGAGTGNHTGYMGWTSRVVTATDQSKKSVVDCTGTNNLGCLGNINTSNSRDVSGVPNVDGGAAGSQRVGSMSPIPAPRVTNYVPASGVITLGWDAVSSNTGGLNAVGYDLFQFSAAKSGTTCPAPNETQLVLLKRVNGTTTTVTRADIGSTAGDGKCAVFALRPVLSNIVGGSISTRYLSQNGQAVNLDGGGGAASVFDITAKWASANNIEVNWKTSLEDGVRGFYVTRATTENGAYVRVSSLIAAKGEPSAYTFVDAVQAQGVQKASGLFYKVETVDIDDNVAAFGPAKAQLPVPGKGVIQQRKPVRK